MYLARVELRNIRGFHGVRNARLDLARPDGSYAGWTVIAGRNGAGKTSLLRAVALAVSGPAVARSLVPDFADWISGGHDHGVVDVNLMYEPEVESFGIGRPPKSRLFRAGLEWAAPVTQPVRGRRNAQPALTELALRSGATLPRRGPWQDNPYGWFCAAYGPFRRLVGGAGDAQRLMLSRGPAARMASLFHEDASLAEGVGWLIEQHLRTLERRPGARELKDAALTVLGDGLLPDGYRIVDIDSDGLWVAEGPLRFPLREMSDGYRTVVALVVDLLKQIHQAYGSLPTSINNGRLRITSPGLVIIDEVDAHLHVTWQKRIGGWLKAHFPRIQFLVTTHSPYICQAADPNGLIRLPGPDEHVPPAIVDKDLYERVVFGSGDDAVLSDLFGLETPYSETAEVLRSELVRIEATIVTGRAGEKELIRYEELKDLLTSSPTARSREVAARLALDGKDVVP
jgi:hypothetical protein